MDTATNPRAIAGDNQPPELTPFDRAAQEISDLYIEAEAWCDGRPIVSQDQADGLSNLLNMIRDAKAKADEARKVEKRPHDEAAAEVQARYKPILGKADLAAASCKKALAPWLQRLADQQAAAVEKARTEAEHLRQLAGEAFQGSEPTNLAERARAEQLLTEAKGAEKVAAKAAKATPRAGLIGRAVGLRTVRSGAIIEETAVASHYWRTDRPSCVAFYQTLVDQDVRAGVSAIPGVRIDTTKQAV